MRCWTLALLMLTAMPGLAQDVPPVTAIRAGRLLDVTGEHVLDSGHLAKTTFHSRLVQTVQFAV